MARDIRPRKPPSSKEPISDDAEEKEFEPVDDVAAKKARRRIILPGNSPISLDGDRKLTKKAKAKLEIWKGKHRGRAMDKFIQAQAERARQEFGHGSVMVGDESSRLVICIPIPALSFEFLIAQDGFPLSLVFQLVSETGIGKSALLAEFGRWFFSVGGVFNLGEAETKFNNIWYRSILGKKLFARTLISRCRSVEDWQRKLTFGVNDLKQYMVGTKEDPGPGRTFPALYGIDSIMGKQSEESMEKILGKVTKSGERGQTGEGHASRGYPIEAQIITRYMRSIPSELDNWPFSLVLVNHLKMSKDEMGNDKRTKAGGEQVGFQESFELELTKVGGPAKMIQCADFEGYPIMISCHKNSFGPGRRKIMTRLLWWFDEDEDEGWEQHTVWDWDWSTIWLLNSIIKGDKASPMLKASLRAADFHLECPSVSDIENSAWSKSLGMKKSDAAPWSDVGAMIRKDRELMDRLRNALRIARRHRLKGDYLTQLDSISETLP